MRNNILITVLICVLLAAPQAALSDTLRLDDGNIFTGRTVSFEDALLAFDATYMGVVLIPAEKIAALDTDREYFIELRDGGILKGRLARDASGVAIILSDGRANAPVNLKEVLALTPAYEKEDKANGKENAPAGIGQQEETEPPLNFLTGSTVLLAPGNFEAELDITYKSEHDVSRLQTIGYFEHSSYSVRQFAFSLTGRGSLWNGGELWLTVPFTHTRIKEVSSNEYERQKIDTDLADISLGVQQLLLKEGDTAPAVSVSLGLSIPTGERAYRDTEEFWLNGMDNGNGHFSITSGLSLVKTIDPAVFFGGVSYCYSFEREISGYDIKPGWIAMGYLGVGLAVNESLSLSARITQAYYSEMTADGTKAKGSDYEPMDLGFSCSYRAGSKWVISPHVSFGLNSDAGASAFGVTMTRKF